MCGRTACTTRSGAPAAAAVCVCVDRRLTTPVLVPQLRLLLLLLLLLLCACVCHLVCRSMPVCCLPCMLSWCLGLFQIHWLRFDVSHSDHPRGSTPSIHHPQHTLPPAYTTTSIHYHPAPPSPFFFCLGVQWRPAPFQTPVISWTPAYATTQLLPLSSSVQVSSGDPLHSRLFSHLLNSSTHNRPGAHSAPAHLACPSSLCPGVQRRPAPQAR